MVVVGIGVMVAVVAVVDGDMAVVGGVMASEVVAVVEGRVTIVGKKGILQGIALTKRSDKMGISCFLQLWSFPITKELGVMPVIEAEVGVGMAVVGG